MKATDLRGKLIHVCESFMYTTSSDTYDMTQVFISPHI